MRLKMASGRRSRGKWLRVLLLSRDVGCVRECASADFCVRECASADFMEELDGGMQWDEKRVGRRVDGR